MAINGSALRAFNRLDFHSFLIQIGLSKSVGISPLVSDPNAMVLSCNSACPSAIWDEVNLLKREMLGHKKACRNGQAFAFSFVVCLKTCLKVQLVRRPERLQQEQP